MSGPKHTPTPARDAALNKAWAEHPELDNEERSAFIYGFEAGWNAAAPRLAEELGDLAKHLETYDPQGDVQAWLRSLLDYHLPAARAALREAGVES